MVDTHPSKNPRTIHLISTVHKSPPTHLLLQGETFPRRGEKHLVVISFPPYFFFFKLRFSPPLHSISKKERENKQRALTFLENGCIASCRPPLALTLPKNKAWRAGWRHPCISTLHHTRCHHRNRPTVFSMWGSVLLEGGVLRAKWICLGTRMFLKHFGWMAGVCKGWSCLCATLIGIKVWGWNMTLFIWDCGHSLSKAWRVFECHSQKPSVGEDLNWCRFYWNLTGGSNDKVQSWKPGQGQAFLC